MIDLATLERLAKAANGKCSCSVGDEKDCDFCEAWATFGTPGFPEVVLALIGALRDINSRHDIDMIDVECVMTRHGITDAAGEQK